jgi:hypothetical protein
MKEGNRERTKSGREQRPTYRDDAAGRGRSGKVSEKNGQGRKRETMREEKWSPVNSGGTDCVAKLPQFKAGDKAIAERTRVQGGRIDDAAAVPQIKTE